MNLGIVSCGKTMAGENIVFLLLLSCLTGNAFIALMINTLKGHLNLIGSEESSWLGIPTLADIREHLIIKLQNLSGYIEPPTDTWDLIHLMARNPAGITNLMRYYYEPNDEDRLLKRKLPSTFHANLARSIGIKPGQVIVTTNRDRLIEWGLAKIGIAPQIVKSSNVADLIPLRHATCTIIKLNGDYLDCDRPKFDRKFKIFLQKEIQQVYQPTICKCSTADRDKFCEFNF
ncbi:MAG: hypothetical protein ACFCAD_02050 [Pleurocapsa sp.]